MSELLKSMQFAKLGPETIALRQEVRHFIEETLTPALPHQRARSWMGFNADFSKKLAARGWVGLMLPKRYGGGDLTPIERFVVVEELLSVGAPVAAHWVAERQSGPLILKYGTQAQKDWYLPRICAADIFFCIGMSEPNSGSDLASVRSKAVKVQGGWKLTGRKIWTTNAHHCQFMVALVRTSGTSEDRQKGLSQFILDLSAPEIEIKPIRDLAGDEHFCEVFFNDLFVADDSLVGQEGQGWSQVNAELAFERSGPERFYSSAVLLNTWLDWVRKHSNANFSAPHISAILGKFTSDMVALRHMSIALTTKLAAGEMPVVEAALIKDLGTAFEQRVPEVIGAVLGALPAHEVDDELIMTLNYLNRLAPSFSLRGGTREILRGMIARGLGLR